MFAKTIYIINLVLLLSLTGNGQNTIGLPDIINYNKTNYNAGLQNWDIRQDKNGIIYVANNEGLLTFDGKYWNIYPLTNKTIVRSVEIGADNKIYVGGQDELGYFAPGENGRLKYYSLTQLIPQKDRAFGDVWDIASFKNEIFFRSTNKIFRFANETVSVFYAPTEWSYMGVCNNRLYAHDHRNGLLYFENNVWAPLQTATPFDINSPVTGILPFANNTVLITTLKNGLYILGNNNSITKLTSSATNIFEQERVYSATKINEDWTALGTSNGGVYIIDSKAQVIQSFAKPEGLQNNNVLSIFLDQHSNLWLGLNTGIDFIAYNSAIKRITPYAEDGSGYTAIIHNNTLYTGTSAGLFSVPLQAMPDLSFSKGTFSPVANTTGQTWGLAEINGKLLLGHHEGAFVVEGNTATPIASGVGFWNFVPVSAVFPTPVMVAGNYWGLTFFNYNNGAFSIGKSVPHFEESSRYLAIDQQNNIWVSHPYHGVYKVSAAASGDYVAKLYNDRNGLPTALNNHVFKVKNEVLVATEKGVYAYNAANDTFEPSPFYKKILGQTSLRYLKEDTEGNTWFIHEKSLGVVDISGKTPAVIYLPELKNKMLSGFEFMYAIDEQNIIIGGENGFFHINYKKYIKNIPELRVQLRSVRIIDKKDSLLFGGYFSNINEPQSQAKDQVPSIGNNWKTIHFEFSSPEFGQQSNLEYSYRLKGFDDNWAAWSNKTEKEYTNLSAGTYSIEIKVRNNLGAESAPVSYTFKVLPPWYQTTWANIMYVLLLLAGIYFLYTWQRKKFHSQQARHDEEQKKIKYLHQLEIDKTENELVALRNEKLQAEIDFKNTELASSAMHLVQKGELLAKMKATLTQLMKLLDNEKAIAELKRMIKVLSEDDKKDKDWENFAQHFDKVNSDFVGRLKERHSNISPNELKLCAYLRMNLTTKEIAQLMNISIRGVEISRYRLRKKLGIATEVSLFDYFMGL